MNSNAEKKIFRFFNDYFLSSAGWWMCVKVVVFQARLITILVVHCIESQYNVILLWMGKIKCDFNMLNPTFYDRNLTISG